MAEVEDAAATGSASPPPPTTVSDASKSMNATVPDATATSNDGSRAGTAPKSQSPSASSPVQANGDQSKLAAESNTADEVVEPEKDLEGDADVTASDVVMADGGGSEGEVDQQVPRSEARGKTRKADAENGTQDDAEDKDESGAEDNRQDEGEEVGEESAEEEEEDDDDDDEDDDDEDEDDDEEEEEDDDGSDSGSDGDSRSISRASAAAEGAETVDSGALKGESSQKESGIEDEGVGAKDAAEGEGGKTGEGAAAATATPNVLVPKPKPKKKRRITPSLDPAPSGPPARPTVRISLMVSHDDNTEYMANVPVEVYKHLKAQNEKDPYAAWFEETKGISSALAQEEAEQANQEERPDLSGFGDLARLLEKYPVDKGNKKRKRAGPDDEYDVRDPFVDDSELNVDEPTHSAKPSSDGFFVTEGPVELAQMKRSKQLANKASGAANGAAAGSGASSGGAGAKKSAAPLFTQPVNGIGGIGEIMVEHPSTKVLPQVNILLHRRAVFTGAVLPQPPPPPTAQMVQTEGHNQGPSEGANAMGVSSLLNGPSSSGSPVRFDGTRQSPIKVDDDEGDPRKPAPPLNDARKAARYPTVPVDLKLQEAFDSLRQQIARESWLNKAKFPPALKPPLVSVAMLAIDLGEYNDNFFNHLPQLFPYNRFTMQKLTKREAFQSHQQKMTDLQETHIDALQRQIQEHLPFYRREYEEAYQRWLEEGGADKEGATQDGQSNAPTPLAQTTGDGLGEEVPLADGDEEGAPKSEGAKPVKRWKWNDHMREILFTIVAIEDAVVELRNEKTELEKSVDKASNITSRKALYKRLSDLWPEDGWTTTTYISREMGLYKRKVDRYIPHVEEVVPIT